MAFRKKSREEEQPSDELAEVELSEEEVAEDEAVPDTDIRSDLRELANKKLRHKLGVKTELKNLPSLLHENEQVLNLAAGHYDGHQGLLVVTDRRLLFYEKGLGRSRQEALKLFRAFEVALTCVDRGSRGHSGATGPGCRRDGAGASQMVREGWHRVG